MDQAHTVYQSINNQLHVQLPDLYDSRVALCVDVLSKLAEAERAFHSELSEVIRLCRICIT